MSTNTESIRQQIVTYMVDRLGMEPEEITLTARFKEDLELDSLDMVELVTILEGELGTEVDDQAAQTLTTLGDVLAFIESRSTADGTAA
ncbi:acyl carrier protein [Streptomyces sp. URMC 127]|uniref:acyl carrier protein n=1 Tax=Streptomyces sp. URMC 127 TaxID=3423402 RepID=UPI003F1BB955